MHYFSQFIFKCLVFFLLCLTAGHSGLQGHSVCLLT